ncbi:MAG: hypothetical protein VX772_11305 [Bacteroidota bacterium]|nr:hypothetical protein [Bacteroidota bacterium]
MDHLKRKGLNSTFLKQLVYVHKQINGKLEVKELHPKTEGYLFFSTKNIAEKPVNLILKLDYLERIGVAKKLV